MLWLLTCHTGCRCTTQPPPPASVGDGSGIPAARRGMTGVETAERIMRDRIERGESAGRGAALVGNEERRDGEKGLGKFYFESKQQ